VIFANLVVLINMVILMNLVILANLMALINLCENMISSILEPLLFKNIAYVGSFMLYDYMMIIIISYENIWFVWSQKSYSGDMRRC